MPPKDGSPGSIGTSARANPIISLTNRVIPREPGLPSHLSKWLLRAPPLSVAINVRSATSPIAVAETLSAVIYPKNTTPGRETIIAPLS